VSSRCETVLKLKVMSTLSEAPDFSASAVIPTVIANAFYLPHHLLPETEAVGKAEEPREVTRFRQAIRKVE
jgi:hypothetical protein